MHVNFISSNGTGEIRTIFLWNDNEEIILDTPFFYKQSKF